VEVRGGDGARDIVKKALKAVQLGGDWYDMAQDREKWRTAWSDNLVEHQRQTQRLRGARGEKTVECLDCGRWFRRDLQEIVSEHRRFGSAQMQ
jgi:hypothetical protein